MPKHLFLVLRIKRIESCNSSEKSSIELRLLLWGILVPTKIRHVRDFTYKSFLHEIAECCLECPLWESRFLNERCLIYWMLTLDQMINKLRCRGALYIVNGW